MLKRLISYLQLSRDRFRRWLGLKLFDAKIVIEPKLEHPKKIVFLRWDAKWGDAIVSSFVFDEIRRAYPQVEIELVTTPSMAELFSVYYGVKKVHEIKKRPKYSELKALANKLGRVDILVHMSPSLKMKDLYFLNKVGAKIVAGLDDHVNMINLKLGQKTKGMHFAEKFEKLLIELGIQPESTGYRIPIDETSLSKAERFMQSRTDSPLLVFNPYGSGGSRKLNRESIETVLDLVLKLRPEFQIALLYTPETKDEVQKICDSLDERVFFYPYITSIFDAIAMVKQADWVISVDTAIVHIATGLKKAQLVIYNTDHENYLNWHPKSNLAKTFFSSPTKPLDINNIDWKNFSIAIHYFINDGRI